MCIAATGKAAILTHVTNLFVETCQTLAKANIPVATGPCIDCEWRGHTCPDVGDCRYACDGLIKQPNAAANTYAKVNHDSKSNVDSGEETAVDSAVEGDRVKGRIAQGCTVGVDEIRYAARMARPDLLRPTTRLTSYVTTCRPYRGKPLHSLVCYMWCTLDYMQECYTSQRDAHVLQVVAYADPDVAGCVATMRSTSGGHLCLDGPSSHCPIHSLSKRPGSTVSSTPEA